jgi:ferredoxin-NADP reductase
VKDKFEVYIASVMLEADNVKSYDLRPLSGTNLAPFKAGAHIDVFISDDLSRSYSLCNLETETHRYVIAVSEAANSRGGSRHIHKSWQTGDRLAISKPRNNFPLVEGAARSVFIAGGIGITPLWCMIQRLDELERAWDLYFCCRMRQLAPFLNEIEKRSVKNRASLIFDVESPGSHLDIYRTVTAYPIDTHFYCCGPERMLGDFEAAARGRSPEYVHTEYFSPKAELSITGGFSVRLARSGRTIFVEPGHTILQSLEKSGIQVHHSCMEGVCGACETHILDGIPDHRDSVLTDSERQAGKLMMICCSGSKTNELVLDL